MVSELIDIFTGPEPWEPVLTCSAWQKSKTTDRETTDVKPLVESASSTLRMAQVRKSTSSTALKENEVAIEGTGPQERALGGEEKDKELARSLCEKLRKHLEGTTLMDAVVDEADGISIEVSTPGYHVIFHIRSDHITNIAAILTGTTVQNNEGRRDIWTHGTTVAFNGDFTLWQGEFNPVMAMFGFPLTCQIFASHWKHSSSQDTRWEKVVKMDIPVIEGRDAYIRLHISVEAATEIGREW